MKKYLILFALILIQGCSSGGGDSDSSTSTSNNLPVANAGSDQIVFTGSTVVLDGSASFDLDGDVLSASWSMVSKPDGSIAQLFGADTFNPSFSPDIDGIYNISLVVIDFSNIPQSDTMIVNSNLNNATSLISSYMFNQNLIVESTRFTANSLSGAELRRYIDIMKAVFSNFVGNSVNFSLQTNNIMPLNKTEIIEIFNDYKQQHLVSILNYGSFHGFSAGDLQIVIDRVSPTVESLYSDAVLQIGNL